MPVDPQIQQLLDAMAQMDVPAFEDQTPESVREAYRGFGAMSAGRPDVGSVDDRTIPGPAGDIPIRTYSPPGAPGGDGPFGGLVWYHGGGWVVGDLETHDNTCRVLCAEAGVVVVAIDYRLAPEHPFPAGSDDAWAALEWVASKGGELGLDPSRLAVGGDSAGGNLAALVAIRARDEGGPALKLQLLVYPGTDLTMGHPSIVENGEGYFLTAADMRWFADHYLGAEREHGDPSDPRVSPLAVDDLRGLPPAVVVTAGFDPLRDEGDAYAARLASAGVPVIHDENPTMIHGFFQMAELVPAAAESVSRAAVRLRDALAL